MKFNYWDLGQQPRGAVVEVTLAGTAANVRLLDSSNFSSYKAGRKHSYFGGHAKRSPVTLQVPRTGHWYVTVDFGGHAGNTRVGVKVLPGPLPTLQPSAAAQSLQQIEENAAEIERPDVADLWDVFISHASEDKDTVARPLATELRNLGLRVWFDEFELQIGSSLRRNIDRGLATSRFGVVVLSPSFFVKNWPQYELDGLVTRAVSGDQVLLPIWHGVSFSEVAAYSPSLADKLARSTTDTAISQIAREIASVVHK